MSAQVLLGLPTNSVKDVIAECMGFVYSTAAAVTVLGIEEPLS